MKRCPNKSKTKSKYFYDCKKHKEHFLFEDNENFCSQCGTKLIKSGRGKYWPYHSKAEQETAKKRKEVYNKLSSGDKHNYVMRNHIQYFGWRG